MLPAFTMAILVSLGEGIPDFTESLEEDSSFIQSNIMKGELHTADTGIYDGKQDAVVDTLLCITCGNLSDDISFQDVADITRMIAESYHYTSIGDQFVEHAIISFLQAGGHVDGDGDPTKCLVRASSWFDFLFSNSKKSMNLNDWDLMSGVVRSNTVWDPKEYDCGNTSEVLAMRDEAREARDDAWAAYEIALEIAHQTAYGSDDYASNKEAAELALALYMAASSIYQTHAIAGLVSCTVAGMVYNATLLQTENHIKRVAHAHVSIDAVHSTDAGVYFNRHQVAVEEKLQCITCGDLTKDITFQDIADICRMIAHEEGHALVENQLKEHAIITHLQAGGAAFSPAKGALISAAAWRDLLFSGAEGVGMTLSDWDYMSGSCVTTWDVGNVECSQVTEAITRRESDADALATAEAAKDAAAAKMTTSIGTSEYFSNIEAFAAAQVAYSTATSNYDMTSYAADQMCTIWALAAEANGFER